jgi:hypothetical protein
LSSSSPASSKLLVVMVAANVLDVVAAAKVLEDVVAAPHQLALAGGEVCVAGGACENLGLAAKPIEAKISSSGVGAGAGAFFGWRCLFLAQTGNAKRSGHG